MIERLRGWADGRPGLGWFVLTLDVQRRFSRLQGGFLAAAVTLMAFLSVFPLVVAATAAVGLLVDDTAALATEVIDGLGIPADGAAAEQIHAAVETASRSARAASLVAVAGLLWIGLGLVRALESAINAVWQVAGRGIKGRLAGLVWLAGAAVLFALSFGATAGMRFLPGQLAWVGPGVGLGVAFLLWWWAFRVLGNRDVGWAALVPGAVLAAVGVEVLQIVGSVFIPRAVASASALYGSIGLVFAVLAWLFVFGRLLVYSTVLNVVLWERRHGTVVVPLETPWLPGDEVERVTRTGTVTRGAGVRVR